MKAKDVIINLNVNPIPYWIEELADSKNVLNSITLQELYNIKKEGNLFGFDLEDLQDSLLNIINWKFEINSDYEAEYSIKEANEWWNKLFSGTLPLTFKEVNYFGHYCCNDCDGSYSSYISMYLQNSIKEDIRKFFETLEIVFSNTEFVV